MRYMKGDLVKLALKGEFNAIIHGCNCFHAMGAGIAKQISRAFPNAYNADILTPYGDRQKLGTYSHAWYTADNDQRLLIVNAYTQFQYGRHKIQVDYKAIDRCFNALDRDMDFLFRDGLTTIGIPRIGCGLAGGDWDIVRQIIEQYEISKYIAVIDYLKT